MKNVYNNKELCHVWANEKQDQARGSNMYFNSNTIYSYGDHFPIAKIYHSKRGKMVLFTIKDYSSTTAKHKSFVSQAINDPVCLVDNVIIDTQGKTSLLQFHHDNLNGMLSRIDDLIKKASSSHKTGSYKLASASNFMTQYLAYIDFFKPSLLSIHKKASILMDKAQYIPKDILDKVSTQEARANELQKKREARQLIEEKEDLNEWLHGADKRRNFQVTALRIKDGFIETTKGARVTVQAGRLLYAMIQAGKDIKGYDIEGYTVISINGTLKIGCHEIPIEEVNRIGALLI